MKMITKAIEKKLPKIGTTDGQPDEARKVIVKFFDPYSSWTWYVVEGEQWADGDFLFFGYVTGLYSEWGYFTLSHLESLKFSGRPRVKRDLYGRPKTIADAKKEATK